ncbi:response regulator [Phycicoccus duodecadis]|uniref:Response regulator receiver domain-containing protein n=1 Tax=Phycicoccus duodecadis TaxID=173053 RepID=A0A2N3YGU3_9MICO|nr:response regulator [Phycicoccus duodecadis]PKW26058.1 response regulator receiver domain-containing protein [Phycicoccus duodecadis]
MQSGPEDPGAAALVLVCDDTEGIRRLLRINLELAGFAVEEASDGHQAMARLIDPHEPVPRVILLDQQMSPYDGWWAIAAIRSHPRLDTVPVVLITAASAGVTLRDATTAGFDAFLSKPFDPDEVVDTVSRLAAGGRRRRRRR